MVTWGEKSWIASYVDFRFIQSFTRLRNFVFATISQAFFRPRIMLAGAENAPTSCNPSAMPPCEPITGGHDTLEEMEPAPPDTTWIVALDNMATQISRDTVPMSWPFYCKECRAKIIYVEMVPGFWQPVCPCIQH